MIQSDQQQWATGSYCATGQCVEIARVDDTVLIRDSKQVAATPGCYDVLTVPASEFDAGIGRLGEGEPVVSPSLTIEQLADGTARFSSAIDGVSLSYYRSEYDAFLRAALAGEFNP